MSVRRAFCYLLLGVVTAAPAQQPVTPEGGLIDESGQSQFGDEELEDRDIFAGEVGYITARERIKNAGCVLGGTIEQCLRRKAIVPNMSDRGWTAKVTSDGGYLVTRTLVLSKALPLTYRWVVHPSGRIEAMNMRAMTLTE